MSVILNGGRERANTMLLQYSDMSIKMVSRLSEERSVCSTLSQNNKSRQEQYLGPLNPGISVLGKTVFIRRN